MKPAVTRWGPALWLVSPGYDLTFVIFSAVLLALPHLSRPFVGTNIGVDLLITMLIGGPHLFATYTMTLMEPEFRTRYPRYVKGAVLLPVIIAARPLDPSVTLRAE